MVVSFLLVLASQELVSTWYPSFRLAGLFFCLVGVVLRLLSCGTEANPFAVLRACRAVARWAVFSFRRPLVLVLLRSCMANLW